MVRMARESEITVLQAGGISSMRIVLGLILFGALATGAYNTAQRNNDAAQLGWGELSLNSKKPGMNPIYRSISQSGGDPFSPNYGVY
jgi:hypothetical protein